MRLDRTIWILLACSIVFLLAGCSLAEDITPPPNYQMPTPLPEQPVESSTIFPLVPPDPLQGQVLFLEKCEPCHGPGGMGDGSLAANLSNPAPLIGSAELARQARPMDWYHVVTQGRMERQMPPFINSLSDRERWDVVAYALSLSITPEERAAGKTLYDSTCADCHGLTGDGDGPQAASLDDTPANWQDQERLASFSIDNIIDVITGGTENHPAVAAEWNAEERYAAAAYVRLLSFAGENNGEQASAEQENGASADAAPGEAESEESVDSVLDSITISGAVTNATQGGSLPADMQVVISAFDGMSPAFEATGTVADDGSYAVEGVSFDPSFVYFAQVEANGLTFNSDILHGSDVSGPQADLPIRIYDTTTDRSAIRADRLHIFFDFTQPGLVQIINLYILSNSSDMVVVPETQDGAVVNFSLPEGASDLQFQDGEMGDRFIETENGFGDRMSIVPGQGEHQILFAYTMPYDRKLDLTIVPPAPVEDAIVMVPPVGVRLKSEQLMDAGQRDVQGMSFQMYQSTNSLSASETLNITLTGRAGTGEETETDSIQSLVIGIGLFGLALLGAGIWLYRQRSQMQPVAETVAGEMVDIEADESSETVLDAIITLDDLHASGKLPDEAYQQRRDELKERLAQAIQREGNA